jgi:hypothetical protein
MISPSGCSSAFFEAFLGAITVCLPALCSLPQQQDSKANKTANGGVAQKKRRKLCIHLNTCNRAEFNFEIM